MQTFYPGQGFTIYTDFDHALDNPPHFEIRRATDNALVQEGSAQQDDTNVQRWTADVVLPDATTEGLYSIDWLAKSGTTDLKNTERFTVGAARSEYIELDRLALENRPITDVLLVDQDETLTDVTVSLTDITGTVRTQQTATTPFTRGGETFLQAVFPDGAPAGQGSFACYMLRWDFTRDNRAETELHFVYIATPLALAYVNELRRMIDKAQLQHKNPALRYNDVDLIAFLNLGLQRINSSPPNLTSYSLTSLPPGMMTYLLNAAAVEALNARYLAEAEAAFSFTGAPISLEVDRTGFIDSARQQYQTALEDLKTVKKIAIMSTGSGGSGTTIGTSAGVLVLAVSPSLDLSGSYVNQVTNLFRPGSRAIFYDEILANLL